MLLDLLSLQARKYIATDAISQRPVARVLTRCWRSKCSGSGKGKLSYGGMHGGVKGLPVRVKLNLFKLTRT